MNIKLEKSEIALIERVNEPRERKRKLRPLLKISKHPRIEKSQSENGPNSENLETENSDKKSQSKVKWFLFLSIIGIFLYFISQIELSRCGLWATYNNNFNLIVHGDERYCHRELNPKDIVDKLNYNLVNQNDAIRLIEVSLNLSNREKFISMAFSGSVGVGKTLSSSLIAKNFKWKNNVNEIIYEYNFQQNINANESIDSDLEVASMRFSECGFNLLIIDDIPIKKSSIERIKRLERKLHEMAKRNLYKIVLIVIFRGEVSQELLPNFVIIEFQPFNTQESFNKCIDKHLQLLNVNLKPNEILELQKLNFTTSGCKTVMKKINLMDDL